MGRAKGGLADETEENCSRMELNVHGIAGKDRDAI